MSKNSNRSNKVTTTIDAAKGKQQVTKGIYLNLPTPNPDVIKSVASEAVLYRYLETIEKIAKLEADTMESVARRKFGAVWKTVLITCVFIFLLLGLAIGNKLTFKWGEARFETQNTKGEMK